MKKNPRLIGDNHVKEVHQALQLYLTNYSIEHFKSVVKETVYFIFKRNPGIKAVISKFEMDNPDQYNDLILITDQDERIPVNLFLIKLGGRIQPKNPGAKSFFSKYFQSEEFQKEFNILFDKEYRDYLNSIVNLKLGENYLSNHKDLKRFVKEHYPKFTNEINKFRDSFLYSLREICFNLLKEFYNVKSEGFFYAYNSFFMVQDLNIVTRYGKDDHDVIVEEFKPGTPTFRDIQIYKLGKNTVGIRYGEVALTLRFKFESSPVSSIKLAASYDLFPNEVNNKDINQKTIQRMIELFDNHSYVSTSNSSNAIGKCHEAITYFYFLKEYPDVSQVELDECVDLLSRYYSQVKPDTLSKLYTSTATLIPVVRQKLSERYTNDYRIENIELVPESYINDKLDTGDLQLILLVNDKYVVENLSLKALAKKSGKITTKNPGIGTILGPTYFNIGSLKTAVEVVKERFSIGEISHRESLALLSEQLGSKLQSATQSQLRQGVENLLGKAMMVVTVYEENITMCKEHSSIEDSIKVFVQTPSAIQNTLAWNSNKETISLRVKFSRGQSHGWSTVKLTSEYQMK